MTFEEHLRALVYFHLEEHHSAQHLLQVLEEDDFAKSEIAPENGIKKSSFSEATNSRGLSSSCMSFKICRPRPLKFYPNNIPNWQSGGH